MDVLKFFTMNNWNFKSENFVSLMGTQSSDEQEIFPIDTKTTNEEDLQYLRSSLIGGRQYCARDPLTTLPRAKKLLKM